MAMTATASPKRLFDDACEDLRSRGLIEGAVLISRDGFPLAGQAPGVGNLEVFAAMHATALGAAEVALAGIGPSYGVTLVAEHGGRKFVSRGLTTSLFCVASVPAGADCQALIAWMDELAARLAG